MRNLSWEEFDEAVFKLASTFEGVALNGVYGFPRGGLPLAVALSHQLSIPLLKEPEEDCLFVDDVYETGKTLKQAWEYDGSKACTWMSKQTPTWFTTVEITTKKEWLVFPWESVADAQIDMEKYYASH